MSKHLFFFFCSAILLIEICSGVVIARKRGVPDSSNSNNQTSPVDEEKSRNFLSELMKQFEESEKLQLPVAKHEGAPAIVTTNTEKSTVNNVIPSHYIISQLNEPGTNNVSRYIITDPIKNISTVIYLPKIIIPTNNSQAVGKVGPLVPVGDKQPVKLHSSPAQSTTALPPSAQFQPSHVFTTPLEPIKKQPITPNVQKSAPAPTKVHSNPTNNHGTVGDTENIPSNLFQAIPAETERPILLRPVPNTERTFIEREPTAVNPNNYYRRSNFRESSMATAMQKHFDDNRHYNTNDGDQADSNDVTMNFRRHHHTNPMSTAMIPQSMTKNFFDHSHDEMPRFPNSVNSDFRINRFRNNYEDSHDAVTNHLRNYFMNMPGNNLQTEHSSPMISSPMQPLMYSNGFQTSPISLEMSAGSMGSGLINSGPMFDDDNLGGMQNSYSFHRSSHSVSTNGGPPITRTVEYGSNNGKPFGRVFDF